jgi:hypothetical protein
MILAHERDCPLLPTDEVGAGFAAADQPHPASLHQNLCGARARIVVRCLNSAVGAGSPQDEYIIRSDISERPIPEEAIARFADGADDVGAGKRSGRSMGARDGMRRII